MTGALLLIKTCTATLDKTERKNSQTRKIISLDTMWASKEFQGKEVGEGTGPLYLSFRLDKRFSCYEWKIHVLSLT